MTGNEPAFPQHGWTGNPDIQKQMEGRTGMSLRDWFAGQALIGILGARNGFLVDCGIDNAPDWAYRVADAMLAERGKTA